MTNWVHPPWWEPFPLLKERVGSIELAGDRYARVPETEAICEATKQLRQVIEGREEICEAVTPETVLPLSRELHHMAEIAESLSEQFASIRLEIARIHDDIMNSDAAHQAWDRRPD